MLYRVSVQKKCKEEVKRKKLVQHCFQSLSLAFFVCLRIVNIEMGGPGGLHQQSRVCGCERVDGELSLVGWGQVTEGFVGRGRV